MMSEVNEKSSHEQICALQIRLVIRNFFQVTKYPQTQQQQQQKLRM